MFTEFSRDFKGHHTRYCNIGSQEVSGSFVVGMMGGRMSVRNCFYALQRLKCGLGDAPEGEEWPLNYIRGVGGWGVEYDTLVIKENL